MIIEADAYLDHAGVKGMKWGVRKAKSNAIQATSRKARHRQFMKNARKKRPEDRSEAERQSIRSDNMVRGANAVNAILLAGIGVTTLAAIKMGR